MNLFTQIRTIFIWAVIFLPFACYGQRNAPVGALPMQYNSSFAGSNGGPRISLFAGYERYPRIKYTFYGMYTSYDQFIPKIRSGIGITAGLASQHVPANGGNTTYNPHWGSVSLAIAPKFSIQGKYTISPSLNLGYGRSWNQSYGNYIDGVLVIRDVNVHSFSSGAAVLFNTHKYYIGYSVSLGGKFFYSDTTSSRTWNIFKNYSSFLQIGYTFQRSSSSKFSFTPQLVFQAYNDSYENKFRIRLEALTLNFRYQKFIWGLNNGGIHLGWQNDKLRFMLTNGLGFLTDNSSRAYTATLSFRYLIPSNMQKKYTVPGQY